ncbi:MAG: hypothetical protein K2Q01_06910, partial [Rickettsiales bacterium]|nr:hypothetical protein [Rickettsiales bacterium]
IMLSAPSGEYISEVKLRLLDANGAELLAVEDAGPYFYAHVPPAAYTLETTNPGEAPKSEKITVPATGALSRHIVYNQ